MPRPADLPEAIEWLAQDLNAACALPAASFDSISAIEVIEHLENPRMLAREWFRLLRPGGKLLVTTPNPESLRSLLSLVVRGHFVDFTDPCYPAHLTPVLAKDLERMLKEAGFARIEINFSERGVLPHFTARSWQGLSCGLLAGKRFSDQLVATAEKGPA